MQAYDLRVTYKGLVIIPEIVGRYERSNWYVKEIVGAIVGNPAARVSMSPEGCSLGDIYHSL